MRSLRPGPGPGRGAGRAGPGPAWALPYPGDRRARTAAGAGAGPPAVGRRGTVGGTVAGGLLLLAGAAGPWPGAARAEEEEAPALGALGEYTDTDYSVLIPQGFVPAEGQKDGLQIKSFLDPADPDRNVSIVTSNISAEYTGLGSFGTADRWGEEIVNKMDNSWQFARQRAKPNWEEPEGFVEAELLDAADTGSGYFTEYTVRKHGESGRYVATTSILRMKDGMNRLFTVTAQCRTPDQGRLAADLKR